MGEPWGRLPSIVAVTGGALSREAGFAPFDPGRMPAGLALPDVVTREGFARAPARVQEFYNLRRQQLHAVRPGPAHAALAALEAVCPGEVLVATRNIDDLHERAGSRRLVHTHGELLKARCLVCTSLSERLDDIAADTACPVCGNGGHLRPHIVWVGEDLLSLPKVHQALAGCRLFLDLGGAGGSDPGGDFLAAARRAGARTIAFAAAPEPAPDAAGFDERILGPLRETVPEFVKRLIAGA